MRKRLQLRLVRRMDCFEWHVRKQEFNPESDDPLFTVWCTRHETRDEAIDYYNDILEDFNAENN